jgi:uncharacterized protein (TIGR03086 family)
MAGPPDAVGAERCDNGVMTEHDATLTELGRDREAVEAARLDGVDALNELLPMLREIGARITDEDLERPTACKAFTVAGVLEHMIGGAVHFSPAFRGDTAPAAPPAGTPQERFDAAMTELEAAINAPGAQDRTIAAPFGEVPGGMFARYVSFDGIVHGWDLATATGQSYEPRGVLVAAVDGFARGMVGPEMRDGDTFDIETDAPTGASPIERLVAFSGRRVPTKENAR